MTATGAGLTKTTMWLYEGTKKDLSKFMRGGETWDDFLNRASNELATKKRKVDMEVLPTAKSKRTTVWVTMATRVALNNLRRGGESWGSFFNRLMATLDSAKVSHNPN